jgi:hypothetical protein
VALKSTLTNLAFSHVTQPVDVKQEGSNKKMKDNIVHLHSIKQRLDAIVMWDCRKDVSTEERESLTNKILMDVLKQQKLFVMIRDVDQYIISKQKCTDYLENPSNE